ncbi:MAG: chloride channel protein [Calditrichaceae bacterium]|jgi:chloride channel protein, CIC family
MPFSSFIRKYHTKFLRTLYRINAPKDFYLLFLASIIGTLTGFGAYFLNLIVDGIKFLLFDFIGGDLLSGSIADYFRILIPAIGGLCVGLLTYYLSPEVKGHGIPGVMDAIANKGGFIRRRVAILTSITSGFTIGSGGSAGKEGPIVQIGSAIGSGIGQMFRVSQQRLKILVGCGAAAGLAAVFNAPIAGVVFAIEVILADFSLTVFTPIVISSVIATAISRYTIGSSPFFAIPTYTLHSLSELPLYMVMGLTGGVLSVFFIVTLYKVEDYFEDNLQIPSFVKPALGGLLTGIIAYWYPELYGFDDTATHTALIGQPDILFLGVLVFAKILATSFTLGSGGTGGLFTPSLFIGAMFGALFGTVVGRLFPEIAAPPGAYALVGMGVIVAGTIHAPLSALLIIFEVTADYKIILPLMLGTVTSTLVARWLKKDSIYTMKISFFSHRTADGRNQDILQTHQIQSIVNDKAPKILYNTGFDEILQTLMSSRYNSFTVTDKENKVIGIIAMRDLRPVLFDRELAPLLLATDVMSENIFVAQPDDSLGSALDKMEIGDSEILPVVDSPEKMHYMGVISREDIMKKYRKESLLLTEQKD